MSEKAEKKHDAAPAAGGDEKKKAAGGMMGKLPVLLGGVMIVEAVVLFAGFKFIGGGSPKQASAEVVDTGKAAEGGDGKGPATQPDAKRPIEVLVAELRDPNRRNGHSYMFDVSIVAETRAEFEDRVKSAITEHGNLIRDRIRTIIAQSDPEKLSGAAEPGLETLRRQIKYQLDEIVGDGLIDEVLVPKCIPIRTDY